MIYDYYDKHKGELFIYKNNLYLIEYPIVQNEPTILMPDVIYLDTTRSEPSSKYFWDIYVLFKDGTIFCETTGREYYLKNAFKISVDSNKLLAIAPHKILYVMFDKEIQFTRRYFRLITDGRVGYSEEDYYRLIINGRLYYAAVGRMKIKPPYKLLQWDYFTSIYKNGFLCNNVFYKTGIPPRKVFYITHESCMAFINDGLYYFKNLNNKQTISMFLFDGIDDIFYSANEKILFYFDKKGQFHVWEFEYVKNSEKNREASLV